MQNQLADGIWHNCNLTTTVHVQYNRSSVTVSYCSHISICLDEELSQMSCSRCHNSGQEVGVQSADRQSILNDQQHIYVSDQSRTHLSKSC